VTALSLLQGLFG